MSIFDTTMISTSYQLIWEVGQIALSRVSNFEHEPLHATIEI